MKSFCIAILLAAVFWAPPVTAEFCTTNASTGKILCRLTDSNGRPHNATVSISLTRQGWSAMVAIFVKDWLMVEGDAKIQIGDDAIENIEHITTHRDITPENMLMEAGVYKISEDQLRRFGQASGYIKFMLATEEAGEQEIKFWAGRFSDVDEFIAETREVLGLDDIGEK